MCLLLNPCNVKNHINGIPLALTLTRHACAYAEYQSYVVQYLKIVMYKKLFCSHMQCGRRVIFPVILLLEVRKSLAFLADTSVRKAAGIRSTNKFMFASAGM
ncbi:hypothetical protein DPMN_159362 [Dreissena polymorpha]|uniref:Uncharacterized protein n=1 Tax=Dreissena polymorpha TaxID=45954 RepID=A0A9D4EKY5_DREPO|nr:hypothetical protein DPMN_159362 [Dreissena polymorpha]